MALNAVSIYRLARFAYLRRMPIIPRLLKAIIFVGFNSILPYEADIGQGSKLAHGGIGVVIHPRAVIGQNVLIGQGVTIGARGRRAGAPTIRNGVYIGAGARILGNVVVGSFSVIGANAVVISDVPERSAVGGVPARLLRENVAIGEFEDLPQ